jgi:hypothetical protein
MRGWLLSATLFLALLTVPVWAQRGGGGGHGGMGGGSHGGVSSGHVGGMVSGGAHGAVVPGAGSAYRSGSGWNGNTWHGNGWRGNVWNGNGWNRYPFIRPYPYRRFGRFAYPYWGWGASYGYYPGWDSYGDPGAYDPSVAYDDANPGQPYAPAYPSVVYLAPNGTVEYSQSAQSSGPANPAAPKLTDVNSDTVLVFRDGHTEIVQNYGIAGNTVWVFTETRARKIPLSTIDIPVTQRENQNRGSDFVVPATQ